MALEEKYDVATIDNIVVQMWKKFHKKTTPEACQVKHLVLITINAHVQNIVFCQKFISDALLLRSP